MRRRKLLVALAGLAVVGAAGVIVLWLRLAPRPRITQENFERIKPAMALAEVEAILGPPGDYITPGAVIVIHSGDVPTFGTMMTGVNGPKRLEWEFDTALVSIQMDSSDRVTWGAFGPRYVENENILKKALGWAKRQWRRWLPE